MNNLFFRNNYSNLNDTCPELLDRGSCNLSNPKNKNSRFHNMKNNTIRSLNEVEYFLNNFRTFTRCIKLYKILR